MNGLIPLVSLAGALLNLFPRYDGIVIEITGETALAPAVTASGYTVTVAFGEPVFLENPGENPFWTSSVSASDTGFSVGFDSLVSGVDWALSSDSTVMLMFARSRVPIGLPDVAWQAPPPPPDTVSLPDSVIYMAFESGQGSPWLEDFDTIVIDPGHGGRDPGAIGPSGTYEKDRTLEISLMVRDLLRIRLPEVRVVLTRTSDEYISLGERTMIANRNRADLFVSIHCNAAENSQAHGFETFFLSRARTDDARAVEMLENGVLEMDEVPALADDPLSFLLADMAQSIFQNRSSFLAGAIQNQFQVTFPGRRDRGVKRAGFYVLRGAYMPAVLIEVGFISNREEESQLLSLDFRFRAAEAIVDAIVEYSERES